MGRKKASSVSTAELLARQDAKKPTAEAQCDSWDVSKE